MTRLRFIEVGPAPVPAHHRKAALLTLMDRGFSLVARISTPRKTGTLKHFQIRWERRARVQRIVREAVEREMNLIAESVR